MAFAPQNSLIKKKKHSCKLTERIVSDGRDISNWKIDDQAKKYSGLAKAR